MKKSLYIFFIMLIFTACGDNIGSRAKRHKGDPKYTSPAGSEKLISSTPKPETHLFKLRDVYGERLNIEVQNDHYNFWEINKPIVLVNFFATWCPPCIGQIPHLNNLQRKYINQFSIVGILLYDEDISGEFLDEFIASQKIYFFISNLTKNSIKFADFIAPKLNLKKGFSIPLMVLFVNGMYYTHYEGSTPEEMIESDIKQALNKIKGR